MSAIALLTDFGLDDPYVGEMKAVIHRLAPGVPMIDITHGVRPFSIAQGAFFLDAATRHFAPETVFAAVVDPGVGTERRAVVVQCDDNLYVAPDNGLLSLVVDRSRAKAWEIPIPETEEFETQVFHGRDLFAPTAARLALGEIPDDIGVQIPARSLVRAPWSYPEISDKNLTAVILHVDRFGNCVTNLPADIWQNLLDQRENLCLASPASCRLVPASVYAKLPDALPGLIPGSQGYIEIAINQKSAAKTLDLDIGVEITITFGPK